MSLRGMSRAQPRLVLLAGSQYMASAITCLHLDGLPSCKGSQECVDMSGRSKECVDTSQEQYKHCVWTCEVVTCAAGSKAWAQQCVCPDALHLACAVQITGGSDPYVLATLGDSSATTEVWPDQSASRICWETGATPHQFYILQFGSFEPASNHTRHTQSHHAVISACKSTWTYTLRQWL